MSNPFATPASTVGIDWGDHLGALLLVQPTGFEESIETSFGPSSAVRADIVVLDGENEGDTYSDVLIFPRVLQSQTKPKMHEKVLGRLTQGEAKKGQSPPWQLSDPTEADIETGKGYLNRLTGPATSGAPERVNAAAAPAAQAETKGEPAPF